MKYESKTKKQLIGELKSMQHRLSELGELVIEHEKLVEPLELKSMQHRLSELGESVIEHERLVEPLQGSEEKYRTLIESALDIIFTVDRKGMFTYVNPRFEEVTGCSAADLMGCPFTSVIAPEQTDLTISRFKNGIKGKAVPPYEADLIHKNGERIPVEFLVTTLYDSDRIPAGRYGVGRDVTGRKQSADLYRLIAEKSFGGVYVIQDGVFRFINSNAAAYAGYSPDELMGIRSDSIVHPEDRISVKINARKMLNGNRTAPYEFRIITKGGQIRWIMETLTHSYYEGQPAILGNSMDITENKLMEVSLRESGQRLKTIIEGSSIPTFVIDANHMVLYWNKALEEISGVKAWEIIGTKDQWRAFYNEKRPCLVDLLVDGRVDEISEWYAGKYRESRLINESYEATDFFPALGKCGRWIRFTATVLRDFNGVAIGAEETLEDITEWKLAEEALRESEERFRTIFESALDSIFIKDLDFRYTLVNPGMERLFGMPASQLIGMNDEELFGNEPAADIREVDIRVLGGEIVEEETVKPVNGEETIFYVAKVPMRNDEGDIYGICGVARDITKTKQLEVQLQQAQKMEAIGTLAGGIAHDFNNLLMGIQGRTSLLLMNTGKFHPHYEHLKQQEELINSGANLTRQLLSFAKGGNYEINPTDLNEVIRKSTEMFGRTKKEIRIHIKLQTDVWTVEVDQGMIEQVLLNLYVNAWQAMPDGGDICIETMNVILDSDSVRPYTVEAGSYVKIVVADTGDGMDESTKQRIFEPFFTTKEMGRGTGLGLASAYGIIKNHGGFITVWSEKGHGATFTIHLPASSKEKRKEDIMPDERIANGCETILLVDDEPMILDIGAEILETLGYKVLPAKSGKEGLKVFTQYKNEIDLVILDMIMPEMSGEDVFEKIKEIRPDTKTLLSSGYSLDGQAKTIMERGCGGFIQKPFRIESFATKIREILDQQ
jgi:two-component system cell cycle sensor histidine kinase/response regulator CckA